MNDVAPWNVSLPRTLTIGGEERAIRTDYRAALDCFLALGDADLQEHERVCAVLEILYIDPIPPDCIGEAVDRAIWFLNGGKESGNGKSSGPVLVSWRQDFPLIASAISARLGRDIRDMEMHWWTFTAHFQNIGDCLFAQIVRIRDLRARGKKLDKTEREFEKRNRDLIEIEKPVTDADAEFLSEWM